MSFPSPERRVAALRLGPLPPAARCRRAGSPPRRSLPVQPEAPVRPAAEPDACGCTPTLEHPSRLAPVLASRVSELARALLSCLRHRAPGGSGESWGVRGSQHRKHGSSSSPGLCRQLDDLLVRIPTSVMLGRGRSRGLGLGLLSSTAPSPPRFAFLTLAGAPSCGTLLEMTAVGKFGIDRQIP